MRLEGIIAPLITPLDTDESLDEAGLERLVEYVIAGGVSGIFVLGSSGEGPALSQSTKECLVRAVSEQAEGRVPVLIGALGVGTRNTIEEAKRLTRLGGDAVVVTCPYYFAQTQDEIAAHIEAVARSLDVPTVIYNIPQMVKTVIEPETVGRLAELPEVVGIKDSLGDMERFHKLLQIQRKHQDFCVYQGAESIAAISVVHGASGAVLGLANVAPKLCCDLFSAARSGNMVRAWALQRRLLILWKLHTHGQWLPCLKMAVSQLGICQSVTTAPFQLLTDDQIASIKEDMRAAGVLMQ